MKKSNTQNNLGLFGLLVFTLSMSQGWVGNATAGSATLASNEVIETKIDGAGRVTRKINIEAQDPDTGKIYKDTVTVVSEAKEVTETGTKWDDAVGGEVAVTEKVRVNEATFCSSLGCGDVKALKNVTDKANLVSRLVQQAADLVLNQNLAKEELAKKQKEEEEKKGDYEQRLANQSDCKIKITDPDDKSKDKTLSATKNPKIYFGCIVAKEDVKSIDDLSEEDRSELQELAMSNSREAESIIETIMDNTQSTSIEKYAKGLADANKKYRRAIRDAERGDFRRAFMLNQEILTGSYAYDVKTRNGRKSWGPFSIWGGTRYVRPQSRSYIQAWRDLLSPLDDAMGDQRDNLMQRLNIALYGDPRILADNGRTTIMDRADCDPNRRGCRVRTQYNSMPRIDFMNDLNFHGDGRVDYYRDDLNGNGNNVRLANGRYQSIPNYLRGNETNRYRATNGTRYQTRRDTRYQQRGNGNYPTRRGVGRRI